MPWLASSTVQKQSPTGGYDPNSEAGPATNVGGEASATGARVLGAGFLPAAGGAVPYTLDYKSTAFTFTGTAPETAALGPAPSATPSWISQLSTPSIASGMTAAISNGTVTYSGLLSLLTNLNSSLSGSNSTLTAAEFSDLQTIAANLNNGVTTSGYLTGIMNDLVNGNAANATWTGGNANSTSLGNLAAGSNAAQLSELIGKWFLGTDLPSSSVGMSGTQPFSITYSNVSSPIFGAGGPSMNDINQGYLGDCYFLSSLAEVACKNPSVISSMIVSNGNNTYGVRFYENGTPEYITVNTSLADGGTVFDSGKDIWASLMEKAYAQLQAGGVVTGGGGNPGNSWSIIGNGGYAECALEEITGSPTITDYNGSGRSWSTVTYNSSLATTGASSGLSTGAVQSILVSDLAAGDDLVLGSNTNAKDGSGKVTLVSDHCLSIYGFDSTTGMFEIRNPWGTEASGQYWDTTFEVSLTTLLAASDTITADSVGGSSPSPSAPAVTSQTGTQTWKLGQTVNFKLASNTFTDPQQETLTYKATLANGSPLPLWLTFNAGTETFTGTVPNSAAGLSITVTATDTSNLSTSETFSVLTPPSSNAPVLTSQTGPQTWRRGQSVKFTLASNTFTDPGHEKLTYTATLANGSKLPSWLTFNGATDSFTGNVPRNASSLSIKVTATDTSGLSASETFNVSIAASSLSHAISQVNAAPHPAAIVNLVRPMQGEPHPLFGPKA